MDKVLISDIKKIPNILSLLRIFLIPFFLMEVFSANTSYYSAIIILVISFATDILDGYIARKYNQISELGKILDPAADKLTLLAVLFSAYRLELIQLWIFALYVIKETFMVIGLIYMKKWIKTNVFKANWWGKFATGIFYVAIMLILFSEKLFNIGIWLLYVGVVVMIIAFVTYTKQLLNLVKVQ